MTFARVRVHVHKLGMAAKNGKFTVRVDGVKCQWTVNSVGFSIE